jgi:putative transposase
MLWLMPRPLRIAAGGIVYHVINRRAGRQAIFRSVADYVAFEKVLEEAAKRFPSVLIIAYCLMPNHWHLVLLPENDGELSRFVQWLSVTHMRRWHAHRHSAGSGPLYQGRFKSFPIQKDEHLLIVIRYVERNALRANMVKRAEDWEWCSLHHRTFRKRVAAWLAATSDWPTEPPSNWIEHVNEPQTDIEEAAMRRSIQRGAPFGEAAWQQRMAVKLGLQSSLRDPWRPKKRVVKKSSAAARLRARRFLK